MATPTWDISTGTYASKWMWVVSQEGNSQSMAMSSDGTKAYVVGSTNDTVYQYTLSTPWDISTGTYASKSMYIGTQENQPLGLAFSSDGTKCYVVGALNDTVYQYTLTVAWDISTGSYASKSMSVTTQDTYPTGLAFSSDGTKAYITGNTNDTIYQYTLSAAWDISTGSYASKSMSVLSEDNDPQDLAFSPDGTKCYMMGISTNYAIFHYTLSTPWDISTGSYSSKSLSVSAETTGATGLALSPDGVNLYINEYGVDKIFQYSLGLIYELTGTVKDPSGAAIANADIQILQVISQDISSGHYASKSMFVSLEEATPFGLAFSADGTKAYTVGATNDTVYQYTLSTAWDISTGSYASKSMSVTSQDTSPSAVALSSDGTKAYMIGVTTNTIYQYTLSIAWDISTGSYASKSMSVASQETNPYGLAFSSDGTKAYALGTANDTVYQYTLSTAWDISSGSYASKSMSVSAQDGNPTGLTFSSDGTNAYVTGFSSKTIYQYGLSTAWDISTGSYASKSLLLSSELSNAYSTTLSSDDTKVYVTGYTNKAVYQYNLATAAVKASLTADGSGNYTYTSPTIETDLQVITSTVGPPRRFGAVR